MVVISVYTYGVKIIKKFGGKWFSLGVPWNPPLCTNGSAGYLMQLSVNTEHAKMAYYLTLSATYALTAPFKCQFLLGSSDLILFVLIYLHFEVLCYTVMNLILALPPFNPHAFHGFNLCTMILCIWMLSALNLQCMILCCMWTSVDIWIFTFVIRIQRA